MSHALFPYVVLRRDPQGRTPIASLSDGVTLALIYVTSDGDSKVLFREDLEALGHDPAAAYLDSRERLARLVRARLVRMRAVLGPARVRCLAFEHSFLAASCAVLPNLFEVAHQELKADAMVLAIPRRDLLLVAPNLGESFRAELHAMLGVEDRIFSLEPSGPGWLPGGAPMIGPANVSNDAMIPINVQSVDDTEVTSRVPIGQALRPYRQVVIRKHCA